MSSLCKKVKENWHFLIFLLFLFLFNSMFLLDSVESVITNDFWQIFLIVLSGILALALSLIAKVMITKKIKIQNIFLLIAVPLGLLYMVVLPMGGAPDEMVHYYRAYEISMGNFFSEYVEGGGGDELPVATIEIFSELSKDISHIKYKDVLASFEIKTNEDEKAFINFPTTALYSPLCYLPQALGIIIGRILNLPTSATFYLGRISNFACFLALIYFALKFIPIKKISLLFILFLPTIFQSAISLSPDALTIAVAFSLVSFILYMKYEKKELMSKKEFAFLVVLNVFMSMLKIVYLPICFLIFLIPHERFSSKKSKNIKLLIILVGVIVINLLWLSYSSRFLFETNPGVNSTEQVKFILTSPFAYSKILFRTITTEFYIYLMNGLGAYLGWLNIAVSQFYIFIYFIMLVFIIIVDQNKKRLKEYERWWIAFLTVGVIALIFTSLYVQWTPVQNEVINGIQGRYFLPIILMVALLVQNKIQYSLNNGLKYFSSFAIFLNVYAIVTCFLFHL